MQMRLTVLLFGAVLISHSLATDQSRDDSVQPSELQVEASSPRPKSQKVYHVGGDIKAPRVIESTQPQLDEQQSKQLSKGKKPAKTGSTILMLVVGDDGTVRSVKVFESFNHDLDAKAIDAVKQWKFEPAAKKGIPVAVEFAVKVDFQLFK